MILEIQDLTIAPLDGSLTLPKAAGVYFILAGETPLYIGATKNLRTRLSGDCHEYRKRARGLGADRLGYFLVEENRQGIERLNIRHYAPVLNIADTPKRKCGMPKAPTDKCFNAQPLREAFERSYLNASNLSMKAAVSTQIFYTAMDGGRVYLPALKRIASTLGVMFSDLMDEP